MPGSRVKRTERRRNGSSTSALGFSGGRKLPKLPNRAPKQETCECDMKPTLHHGDRSSNLRLCMHIICDSNLMAWDMLIGVHHVFAAFCVEGFTFTIFSSYF